MERDKWTSCPIVRKGIVKQMEGDLDQVVQDALRACFQRVADRSKGKVSPEDAARMFHKKSGEMLAELS